MNSCEHLGHRCANRKEALTLGWVSDPCKRTGNRGSYKWQCTSRHVREAASDYADRGERKEQPLLS